MIVSRDSKATQTKRIDKFAAHQYFMHIQGQSRRVCMHRQEVSKQGPLPGCTTCFMRPCPKTVIALFSMWSPREVVEAFCCGEWPFLFAALSKFVLCCTCLSSLQECQNVWRLPVSNECITLSTCLCTYTVKSVPADLPRRSD